MDLGELREFVEPAVLKFAIGGKRYVVALATAETWLKLQDVQARSAGVQVDGVDSITSVDLAKMVLGPVYDKLIRDNVPGVDMQRAVFTAFLWQLGNDELARSAWTGEPVGKAPASSRKRTSTSTGGATTTRSRASTRATTSPRKSSAASRAKRA